MTPDTTSLSRRRVLAWLSSTGLAALVAPELSAESDTAATEAAITEAEKLLGVSFTDDERTLMASSVADRVESYDEIRKLPLTNEVPPALRFDARLPGRRVDGDERAANASRVNPRDVSRDEADLPFLSLAELSALVKARAVSSVELTRLSLQRLKRHDERLACVVNLTEERALRMARRADQELARGRWRGPLHGIPWGVKDLLAVSGYPTTWGAAPFRDQVIDRDASVVEKLDAAGAVLVAKLSVGALAWGDVWFGGTTKNPWNLEQGSSGSSAGPAAATVAGLVGFSIGTETLGSIISPSQRCGATGLRPTFGRVSRHGCMALSWSMDKIGPICRTVEDCALVLDAIRGSDDRDATAVDAAFAWDARRDPRRLRIGYDAQAFSSLEEPQRTAHEAVLETLRAAGCEPTPVTLPEFPARHLLFILEAEAAAAFDELTRSGRDELLTRQVEQAWPNVFRSARLITAVEYLQANRARTLLMEQFERAIEGVDAYVHPTYGGVSLVAANLTGHPAVVVPSSFRDDGTPTSISFTGRLFGEAELLTVAKAYQDRSGHHLRRPPTF